MRSQENASRAVWRHLFRGVDVVLLTGLAQAIVLFLQVGCSMDSAGREREQQARIAAQQRYQRERAEAERKGNDPNSAVRKLNSGKWLPAERKRVK